MMGVAPNTIVHLPQLGKPDVDKNRWLLGAQYPVRGAAAPNARAYNYALDEALLNTYDNGKTDWYKINFRYV